MLKHSAYLTGLLHVVLIEALLHFDEAVSETRLQPLLDRILIILTL